MIKESNMNINLVKSLVKTIQSLTPEERKLFEEELFFATEEVTTEDIISLAHKSHAFDFLNDEPDIYNLEDGEAV